MPLLFNLVSFILLLLGIFLIWAGFNLGPYISNDKNIIKNKNQFQAKTYVIFRILISLVMVSLLTGFTVLVVWVWVK